MNGYKHTTIWNWFFVGVGCALYYILTLKGITNGTELSRWLSGMGKLSITLVIFYLGKITLPKVFQKWGFRNNEIS